VTHVEIVPTEFLHIRALCENMRDREREAFRKLGGEPERLITHEVARSFLSFTGLYAGEVGAIWGARCEGILSDEAYIWLVCSELFEAHPIAVLRHSRGAIEELRACFKRLHGLVLDDYTCSIRWLRWLGFEVGEPKNGIRAFRMN
jgi:hypothetical protein